MEKKTKIKKLTEEILMPEGASAEIKDNVLIIKKDSKELRKSIDSIINIKVEGNKILLEVKKVRKNERRKIGSALAHIKNMIEGIEKNYEYELEICNVHFPITVTYDKAKGEFIAKNILGERCPRTIKAFMPEKIEVGIKAPIIKIKSSDLEAAGQNAANLEKLATIRNRDRNKFQDGIFITKKPGKVYV